MSGGIRHAESLPYRLMRGGAGGAPAGILAMLPVHTVAERDFDAAFDDLGRAQASAVLVFPDALFTGVRERLAELATRHKLPVLYPDRSYVEAGGLMSYGSSRIDAYREAGIYAGRILRGEKP